MRNKIAWTILASVLALSWCEKPTEKDIAQEKIEGVAKDSSIKINNTLNCENIYFNNFIYTYQENWEEKKVLNLKWFLKPIWVETFCESDEIIININNFYRSWKTEEENFSDIGDYSFHNNNEKWRSIVENYKNKISPKIVITWGKIIWSTSYDWNWKNDNSIFEEDQKIKDLNEKIAISRAKDMFNDFQNYFSKYWEIEWIENINISSNIEYFSEKEIWELYEIWLKYNSKNVKNNWTLTNLINIFNKTPEKLDEEDFKKLHNIISSKRTSLAQISIKQIWFNSKVEESNFNILILILYSLIISSWWYFYFKRGKRK